MKTRKWTLGLVFLIGPILASGDHHWKPSPILSIVRHSTRIKILESNNVTTRPGSVYDIVTYFESLFEFPRPGFNYEFVDTGLGTAEPLYPHYQKGYQGSWFQLLAAFLGEKNRHIDHFTSLPTPEGCQVSSVYLLRHIDEFGDYFEAEKEEGYEMVVIRAEYYERQHEDAQCGRHRSNAKDPNFNPIRFFKQHLHVKSLSEFPQDLLAKFEARVSVIKHLDEEFSRTKWPRFDLEKLSDNHLWYYEDGYLESYGMTQSHSSKYWNPLQAKDLIYGFSPPQNQDYPLEALIDEIDYEALLQFMKGNPRNLNFSEDEPGGDVLDIQNVGPDFVYTSGLEREPIRDAVSDVEDRSHFAPVSMIIRPYEWEIDPHHPSGLTVPQVRFVYQMIDPNSPKEGPRPFEQLYYHLNFDAVDRNGTVEERRIQHAHLMTRLQELKDAREEGGPFYERMLSAFIEEFTRRPASAVSFSSALTGTWIFGMMTRVDSRLEALRLSRKGVDLGYYSSLYDRDLFLEELRQTQGERKQELEEHLEALKVSFYRDPKRMNVEKIQFNTFSCAQCHHLSGRDAVHAAFNDHLDRRFTLPYRLTEFTYRELDRQLKIGEDFWE